jgi:small-conductance mechanosensitive channel
MDVNMDATQVLGLVRLSGVLSALLIIAMTWALGRAIAWAASRLSQSLHEHRLAIEQVTSFIRFGLYVLGTLLAVSNVFAMSSQVLTLLGGTVAVTLGLSLKDQASSVLAGVMILVEKPFQVGDRVSFAGYYGEIRSIGLRSVRLVTLDDNEVSIPNSKFLSEPVSSGNSGALTMLVQQDFLIGSDQDPLRGKQLVAEALTTSPYFASDLPWTVLVGQVAVGQVVAVRLRAKAYVKRLDLEKAFESDVTERVLEAFAQHDVRPPALLIRTPPAATGTWDATLDGAPSIPPADTVPTAPSAERPG